MVYKINSSFVLVPPPVRFNITKHGHGNFEQARATLVFIPNEDDRGKKRIYGLVEDVFVLEASRGKQLGNYLLKAIISRARGNGCYKLIATSRTDGTRDTVHDWYKRLGFRAHGTSFRMDLKRKG